MSTIKGIFQYSERIFPSCNDRNMSEITGFGRYIQCHHWHIYPPLPYVYSAVAPHWHIYPPLPYVYSAVAPLGIFILHYHMYIVL